MRKLEEGWFQKNGLYYKMARRTKTIAMYSVHLEKEGEPVGYEVFIIKILKSRDVFGKKYEEQEKFPCNEDFGKTAWSWLTLEQADKFYLNIKKELSDGKAKNKRVPIHGFDKKFTGTLPARRKTDKQTNELLVQNAIKIYGTADTRGVQLLHTI